MGLRLGAGTVGAVEVVTYTILAGGAVYGGYRSLPRRSAGFTQQCDLSGSYPSWVAECGQAILAAKAATTAGTRVYAVGYGSAPTGCLSDAGNGPCPNVSPCDTMADIATAPQDFYSDWKQTGSGSTCYVSQPITSLSAIFAAIAADLSTARLIPDSTT